MPVTREDVAEACRVATLKRLKARRSKRDNWPDTKKLGRDDGEGYSFKESTVGTLAREAYCLMALDSTLAEIATAFVFPEGFPRSDFLTQDLRYFRRWIVADVCTQAEVTANDPIRGEQS